MWVRKAMVKVAAMFRFSSYTNINTSCITIHNVGISSLFSLKWFWVVVLFRSFKLNLKYWIEFVVWLCRDYVDNLLVLTRLSRQAGHHSVFRMIGYCFMLLVPVLSSKAYYILFPMVLVKDIDRLDLHQIFNIWSYWTKIVVTIRPLVVVVCWIL